MSVTADMAADNLGMVGRLRTAIMVMMAAVAAVDPSLALKAGPVAGTAVFLLGRPLALKMRMPFVMAFLLVVWISFSTLWTVNANVWISVLTWAALAIMFVATADYIRLRSDLHAVAIGFVAGSLVGVGWLIVVAAHQTMPGGASARIVLSQLNVNYLGYVFSAAFSVIVLLWSTGKRTITGRIGLAGSTVLLAIGVEITETRGAYLGAALVAVWLAACRCFRLRSMNALWLGVSIAAGLIVAGIADRASLVFERGPRATGDWSGRLEIWQAARRVWAEHPLTGIGAGGFKSQTEFGIAAHNVILSLGADLGIVGVMIFILFVWSSLRQHSGELPGVHAVLAGSLLAASAPAYLSGVWETAPAAWVLLALFSRLSVLGDRPAFTQGRNSGPRVRLGRLQLVARGRRKRVRHEVAVEMRR